ncbi:hypothetical protein Sbal117_2632 [Shewanella baltica OS117]|nr:hypothetical protein Sbal117_2632 [Shewanella baltica OS117]
MLLATPNNAEERVEDVPLIQLKAKQTVTAHHFFFG